MKQVFTLLAALFVASCIPEETDEAQTNSSNLMVSQLAPVKLLFGDGFELEIQARSLNGEPLTYRLQGQPDWVSIVNNLIVIAADAPAGDYQFTLQVTSLTSTKEQLIDISITERGESISAQASDLPNFNSGQYRIAGEPITAFEAAVTSIEYFSYNHTFAFNKILFFFKGDSVILENKSPTEMDEVIVKYGENNQVALLKFTQSIPALSRAELNLPSALVHADKIRASYQSSMYSPNFTLGIASSDEPEDAFDSKHVSCGGATCHRPPFGNERVQLATMVTNLHNLYNSRDFVLKLRQFIQANCLSYKNCAAYNDAAKLPYAELMRLNHGYEGHNFTLKLHTKNSSGAHTGEGWGSGSTPSLNNYLSSVGGWGSVKDIYVNEESSQYRPFSGGLYKTLHHEGAHAYGLSHDSGMTYGFSEQVPEFIEDKGLGSNTNNLANLQMWVAERRKYRIPDIYLNVTIEQDFAVTITPMYTNEIPIDDLTIELFSAKPINYQMTRSGLNQFLIQFDESFPKIANPKSDTDDMGSVLFVSAYRTYAENASLVTYKIPSYVFYEHRERTSRFAFDSRFEYFVLEDDEISAFDKPYDVRMRCFNQYATLASSSEYQQLYNALDYHDMLALLPHRAFITRDQSNGYIIADLNDEGFSAKRRKNYTSKIGSDLKAICIRAQIQ